MPRTYEKSFKAMIVNLIINENHSTIGTAKQFDIPLKTVEKWITAYNKDSNVFNEDYLSKEQQIAELKKKISSLERDNEILKKNDYLISKKGLKIFEVIKILSEDYPLNSILKTLNVNKSSYYYWLHNYDDSSKIHLYQSIITIYAESNGIYGSPKITSILNRQGISISSSSVSRIMRLLGIKSIVSKKFYKRKSTLTKEEKALIVNLIKDLEITHINQVWTTDITYIKSVSEGTFFLISFIDYYSKKVIAWGLFSRQTSDEIVSVLEKAIDIRNPSAGLIVHSDKGSQLRSIKYRDFLKKHNIVFSYTSLDHSCDENASQESFHASLKKERLYQTKIYTFEDAYREIYNYIEGFYNPRRVHSSNGYLSPIEFENSAFCS